jgi:hypothetical protein
VPLALAAQRGVPLGPSAAAAPPLLCSAAVLTAVRGGVRTHHVPSDKSNIRHPFQDPDAGHPQLLWRSEEPYERRHNKSVLEGGYMDAVPGAVELAVEAGDALLLVESCVHGSFVRTLPGCRKTILLRYGPDPDSGWKAPPEVLASLSQEARALISPEPDEPVEPELDAEGNVVLDHHGRARAAAEKKRKAKL